MGYGAGILSGLRSTAAWSRLLSVAALCLVVYAGQIYLFYAGQGVGISLSEVVKIAAQDGLIWLLLLPPIIFTYERVGPPLSAISVATHLMAGIAAATAHVAVDAGMNALWAMAAGQSPGWGFLQFLLSQKLFPNLVFYATLVAGLVLIDFHGRRAFHVDKEAGRRSGPDRRLVLADGSTTRQVHADDIHAVQAAGNYACVLLRDETIVIRSTLRNLAEQLADFDIVRAHRSALINPMAISRLETEAHGDAIATLPSGRRIRISRRYRANLEQHMARSHNDRSRSSPPDSA